MDIAHASLTPAMYSFAGVLLQSMVMLAPWQVNWPIGAIFLTLGLSGLAYRIKIIRARSKLHLRAIKSWVDRVFHNLAPIAASVALICGGAGFVLDKAFAPYAIATSTVLLLVSGIYRTWGETLALIELSEKS